MSALDTPQKGTATVLLSSLSGAEHISAIGDGGHASLQKSVAVVPTMPTLPERNIAHGGAQRQTTPRNTQVWLALLTTLTLAMAILFVVMLSSTAFRQMLLGSDALRLVQATTTSAGGGTTYTVGDTQLQVRSDGSLRIGGSSGGADTATDVSPAAAAAASRAAIQVRNVLSAVCMSVIDVRSMLNRSMWSQRPVRRRFCSCCRA